MTMQPFLTGVLALSAMLAAVSLAPAQTRVAPPAPVESAPLAPPPGAVLPAQAPASPNPPAAIPETPAGPTPVQPAPALPGPVTPQPVQPAPTPQVPLEPTPVQPPPTLPDPAAPPSSLPPVQPQQRTGIVDPNATLAGKPGDQSDVDSVLLVAKPVLLVAGRSTWDDGFRNLAESFTLLRGEASKAGLSIAGRPLALFVETDDDGFRFEAMLPVDRAPESAGRPAFASGVRAGMSPSGPSMRFVHQAPYDDIDSTYETITAYLEAKNIKVKDAFLEEYVGDLRDAGDPNLEINVYVQPQ